MEWRNIPFEIGYQISECGKIKNSITGLILKSWIIKSGYEQIQIRKNVYSVHRLSAKVFHSEHEFEGAFVLHLDDDKLNNHYLNLKWGSQSENISIAYKKGRMSKRREKHHLAKFKEKDILIIKNRLLSGDGVCSIARDYGVCHQTISNIKNKKSWV